jgi:4,5-DOPA dioxygenase extradiol
VSNIFDPARPAGAYDDLVRRVMDRARRRRAWTPADGPLPAMFVSHGAPPTLDDAQWLQELFEWGHSLPNPAGIVVVSAHWEDAPVAITSPAAGTPLYYDFGGFHPRYYTLQYRTPDATALARRVAGVLGGATSLHQHPTRGLDHGAFIPLMAMYPAADVPVVQVSMPSLDPSALLTLGARLKPLRDDGVLVMGSGFMTHSFATMRDPRLIPLIRDFDAWAADAIARRDVDALIDYRVKGPGAAIAHPTADHFVPLLVTLGAGDDEGREPTTIIDREVFGNSIRSIEAA